MNVEWIGSVEPRNALDGDWWLRGAVWYRRVNGEWITP